VLAKLPGDSPVKRGDVISLTAPAATLHVFDSNGKAFTRATQH
jgi:hypothetical protein